MCRDIKAQGQHKGVGVIGMCLTGNFAKFQAIDRAFNNDGTTRVATHTLPGKGHSVLTLDFVDEDGHPTREALNEILAYFAAQLQ